MSTSHPGPGDPGSPGPSSPAISDHLDQPDHVVILYASETGNAQDTAERVGREFRRLGRKCVVISMDQFDIFDLPHTPLLILITSTHGRGDPPPAMKPLWNALIRSSLPTDILEDVHYALYGLGDSSYERFCYAGKMLARRMDGLSAVKLGEPAWGDERAPEGIEETFIPWLKQTVDLMLPLLPPPPAGFQPQPSTITPPGAYSLNAPSQSPPSIDSLTLNGNDHPNETVRTVSQPGPIWKPDGWGWATMTRNRRVTREDWWQDVRELEFEIDDPNLSTYDPASICSLQPQNSPEDVETFLKMMDLMNSADTALSIACSDEDQPMPPHLPSQDSTTTLRSLLLNHLDLRASPRKSFFEWLRRFSPDETEQERLDEFIADPDEIHDYATRPSRTILETLADFRHTRIPLSHILEVLPPLRRRQFSIASSSQAHPGKVQLLVALVEYKTNLKIPRKGLCSTWLQNLKIGARVPIAIDPPTMWLPKPTDYLVLVGPGTGVAPMRAFIEERVRQGAATRTRLYFGCRSKDADCYYSSEWEQYRSLGLTVRVAASRDQEDKVYVQDLIKEDRSVIRDWIVDKSGYLYISGSSNAMPRQVREAVAWCIADEPADPLALDRASAFVEEMFDNGHGAEESW